MAVSIKLNYLLINIRYFLIINLMLKPLEGFLVLLEIIKQYKDYRDQATVKLNYRLNSITVDRYNIVLQILKSKDYTEGLTPDEVLLNSI